MNVPTHEEALHTAESILALLYYRGIVDTQFNQDDVAKALGEVRSALSGQHQWYQPKLAPEPRKRRRRSLARRR